MLKNLPRSLRAVTLATALVVLLASCASTSAPPIQQACIDSDLALSQLSIDPDLRAVEGESTACLDDARVLPVEGESVPQLPVTVTDVEGTDVQITSVDRILALDITGALAATVFGLGLGDRVVGRDSSTGFPEAADLPVVTQGGHALSTEPILALAPTIVLTDTSLGPQSVIGQLREAGVAVVITTHERSIDTVEQLITQTAQALGVAEQGERLIDRVTTEIEGVRAAIEEVAPADPDDRLRMIFLYVRGSAGVYYLFGAESGADTLIESLGGIDVASEIGWVGMRPVTAEALIEAEPDLVFVMTKGLESVGGVDGLIEAIPALASTPAGEHRRIVDMDDSQILSFGPRTAQVLDALARAVYAPAQSGRVEE